MIKALRSRAAVFLRPPHTPDPRDATIDALRSRLADSRRRRERLRERLEAAQQANDELRSQLVGVPSHQGYLTAAWREWRHVRVEQGVEEGRQFDNKLTSYAFAQSHGVPIPRLHGRWDDLDALDPAALAAVPEPLMLKSAYGAASHGVVPTADAAEIAEAITRWRELSAPTPLHRDPPIVGPPYFTEERLQVTAGVLVDIKVFAYYGSVGQVLLLSAPNFRQRGSVAMRILSASGKDLGPVLTSGVTDATIPVPSRLDEIVDMARTLSLALRRPFVRLDFYDTGERVVLGEITPMPGNVNRYVPRHDVLLGHEWERARARLRMDLAGGGDARVEWGSASRTLTFADAAALPPPGPPVHR